MENRSLEVSRREIAVAERLAFRRPGQNLSVVYSSIFFEVYRR